MLTALVLICSAAGMPDFKACTRERATSVMRVPTDFGNPAVCFMHGQAYLAGTSIGQELGENDRVTVVCVQSRTIDASVPELLVK